MSINKYLHDTSQNLTILRLVLELNISLCCFRWRLELGSHTDRERRVGRERETRHMTTATVRPTRPRTGFWWIENWTKTQCLCAGVSDTNDWRNRISGKPPRSWERQIWGCFGGVGALLYTELYFKHDVFVSLSFRKWHVRSCAIESLKMKMWTFTAWRTSRTFL